MCSDGPADEGTDGRGERHGEGAPEGNPRRRAPDIGAPRPGADGTKGGYDLELITAVRGAVTVPVIASGGAGTLEHFAPAVAAGADAVLAASVFHFGDLRIGEVKNTLRAAGYEIR